MGKREPFAKLELEECGCVKGIAIAGETICPGDGFWKKHDAESTVDSINGFFELCVGLAVKKAVEEFRERAAAEAWAIVRREADKAIASEVEEAVLSLPTEPEEK